MPDKTLLIHVNNHFDPTWRRCWKRRFTYQGRTYVSYADLEAYYMLDNLELAREHPDYKFAAESPIVVRAFLERHPERLDELRRLAREGRFEVSGAGEAIIDGNMVLGESLVRNFVTGLLWVETTFDQTTLLGVRNDGFGNPAQLPQILRGCEIAWATGMSYTPAQGLYWQGLDGSTILHATLPTAAVGGGNTKYPPCPTCGGDGAPDGAPCEACGGRGIDRVERAWLPGPVDAAALHDRGAALVPVTPEELLPNPELVDWAAAQRQAGYDARFGLAADMEPYVRDWIEQADDPPPGSLHPGVELNPNNAGCWVTRIKTKQTCRRQEYELLGLEALSVMAAQQGITVDREALGALWRDLFFTMFHDAITATHVDPAYAEIQDVWARIDAGLATLRDHLLTNTVTARPEADAEVISVVNLTAHPTTAVCAVRLDDAPEKPTLLDEAGSPAPLVSVEQDAGATTLRFVAAAVPGYSARHYRLMCGGETPDTVKSASEGPTPPVVIENQRFRVEADAQGVTAIYDKVLDRDVAAAADYRPAELILEHDEGSPWATLHPDQSRTRLAPYTHLDRVEQGAHVQRLIFTVAAPRGAGFTSTALHATVTVSLIDGIDRVELDVQAHWDAFNHRLRLAMPVPFRGRHVYEVPYGMLTRDPYDPTFGWAGANGDWPATNWAGIDRDDVGVALLNRGTPAYRMEEAGAMGGGTNLLCSLLRSPAVPTYLHEPEFYTMTDWDGMRDAGDHAFALALVAYAHPLAESDVVAEADGYNAGLLTVPGSAALPPMPEVIAKTVRIAAIKCAERGDAIILRLHEYRGRGGTATVKIPFPITAAAKVNLLERAPAPLTLAGDRVKLTLGPWEIATVRLDLPAS
jgi:alpha-mannosidase